MMNFTKWAGQAIRTAQTFAEPIMTKHVQPTPSPVFDRLRAAAAERILILDGAMGTQIQQLGFGEGDFTGHGGCGCGHHTDHPQQGNNDLLNLTQPGAIEEIHYRYAMAGADIVETNTFSSTTIAQADYGLEAAVYDLNLRGAQIARAALDRATNQPNVFLDPKSTESQLPRHSNGQRDDLIQHIHLENNILFDESAAAEVKHA